MFLLAGAMGRATLSNLPGSRLGTQGGQDNESCADKDPGGEAELEVLGGSQLKSFES